MRLLQIIAILAMMCLCTPPLQADDLETLGTLVEEWLALRQTLSHSTKEWSEQKQFLQEELQLLQRQQRDLQGQLAKHKAREAAGLARGTRLRQGNKQLEEKIGRLDQPLGTAEREWAEWLHRLPPFLAERLEKQASETSPSQQEVETYLDVVLRLDRILHCLDLLEQASQRVHYGRQMVEGPDHTAREIEVLVFGTGFVLGVSADNRTAGMGRLRKDGWQWTWQPDWAPDIRRAIEVHRKKRPAQLVRLPIQLQEADR